MIVFLNGQFVPEEQAVVSVFDRAFLYGDGLFETMLIANARPFRWQQHLERLQLGADFLDISLPFDPAQLRDFVATLIAENHVRHALLRLTLSRGVGMRGYSPRGATSPTLVMTLHALPDLFSDKPTSWKLKISNRRLPANEPLALLKHCNKLPQILARAQAETEEADEALLVNTDGFVVEGATSNLFWVENGNICTPPLASGILSGVTRLVVLELCRELGLVAHERNATAEVLLNAEGVFLSLSSFGIVQGASLDGRRLRQSPLTELLHRHYLETVRRETGNGRGGRWPMANIEN